MKMKRLLLVLLVLLGPITIFAQEEDSTYVPNPPDFGQIKKEIKSRKSDYYYPELLKRFEAADTTLTLEEMRHFYYGTATRNGYDPYKNDLTRELKEATRKETMTESDWRKAASIINQQLKSDPTNLTFCQYKQMVYEHLFGRDAKETYDAFCQVMMLTGAIMSSGDGASKESAIYVICVSDEYAIMKFYGLSPSMQSLVRDGEQEYDVMELEENGFGLENMYFNITVCAKALEKKLNSWNSFGF